MGESLDLPKHLLPYLEAEGGDISVLGLSGGLNEVINLQGL